MCITLPKKKINKKKIANLVPAFGLLPLCWSEAMLFLLSSIDIPTLKSWSVLSDALIQVGDSWALGRVDRLLSSGVDSVKERESLLPVSPGSQSYFVTMPHSSKNNNKPIGNLIRDANPQVNASKKIICQSCSELNKLALPGNFR